MAQQSAGASYCVHGKQAAQTAQLHIWHVDCRPQLFMSLVFNQALKGGGLMVQYIPRFNASLALSVALLVGACAKSDNNTSAADSALNNDIQLANRDTAAQPS